MSSPTNMAGIYSLPDELLLDITQYADTNDLLNLTLTSPRLRRIATEKLYTHPVLDERYSDGYYHAVERVFTFARTLLRRPEVASKVRTLSMSVLRQKPEAPGPGWSTEDISKALRVIEAMGTKGVDWDARIGDWKARLLSGDGKA